MSVVDPNRAAPTLADQVATGALSSTGTSDNETQPQPTDPETSSGHADARVDVVDEVIGEVDQFVRSWVGRFRHVVIRASQLADQESMLKSTLAAVDAQQAEWTRRTEGRERALEQQTKLLTEAWLNLENERRAKLQHGNTAHRGHAAGLPPVAIQPAIALPNGTQPSNDSGSTSIDDSTNAGTLPLASNPAISQPTPEPANALPARDAPGAPALEKISERDAAESQTANPVPVVTNTPPLSQMISPASTSSVPSAANPSIEPIDPWQNRNGDQSTDRSTSDAVKQFKKLRRDIRGN